MILLEVDGVEKHFGPEAVLDGVSFEVRPGDRIGLVGPNGAGKTTLLSALAGRLEADGGRIMLHPSARLGYLEQHVEVVPGRTLWDEALQAVATLATLQQDAQATAAALAQAAGEEHNRLARRYDQLHQAIELHDAYNLDHKIERVLNGLGFAAREFRQPVEQLSGGQQNRLMLVRLLLAEPDVLLLDEPSNHLDIDATQWLEDRLASSGQALVVVSHDRYFLDKVTNRTLELYAGVVDDFAGNFSAYWRQKADRLKVQSRTYEKQRMMIAKTEDFIRRNHYGQKHAQAKDREKKLARIERVDAPREIAAPVMGFPKPARTGDIALRVEGLAKAYDRPLFADLSFDVARGQRFGVLGPNGSGKTTLLRCLVGETKPDDGRVIVGAHVKIGYYDQLLTGLPPDSLVVDAIRPGHKILTVGERRSLLGRFGISGDMAMQTVGSLSGGERSRVALARLAAEEANFLVLDEPTNHLDLWACDALERSLLDFEGTLMFVSHDRYFLNRIADHVLVVEPGRFRLLDGNYDDYLRMVDRGLAVGEARHRGAAAPNGKTGDAAPQSTRERADTSPTPKSAAKRKRRFPYRKVADLEADIFARETRVEEIHTELAAPETLRDGDRVKSLQAELASVQASLEDLYEHWEEATELN